MLEMLLFWSVYGLWMVFTWLGASSIILKLMNTVVKWVTNEDYNLHYYDSVLVDRIICRNVIVYVSTIIGGIATFCHSFVMFLNFLSPKQNIYSFHEFAVIVSEWTVATLSTPLLFTLVVVGLLFLVKKLYPFFKKVKVAVDKLDNNM